MKVFIFAIGGTGARALRALSFCLASGAYNVTKDMEFVPMIIDYDANNGDKKRAVEALKNYRRIHEAAFEQNNVVLPKDWKNFFLPRVSYLTEVAARDGRPCKIDRTFEFTFNGTTSESKGTFAKYLDLEHMTGDKFLTAELLRALYNDADVTDEDYEFTELNLDLSVGFKGNPNIGTVVFDKISSSPEFTAFTRAFDPANDRVFIIGSIFGGTGSSGFPQMIKAIRNHNVSGFRSCKVGASVVMPYFKVDTPQTGGAINSNIFKSKQKAALDYYLKMEREFDLNAAYYVADQDNLQTNLAYSEGNDSQRNNAHVVELLSALSLLDFTIGQYGDERTLEFALQGGIGSKISPLTIRSFGDASRQLFLKPMAYLALAGKYYQDNLLKGGHGSLSYYQSMALDGKLNIGEFGVLNEFVNKYFAWLGELNNQEHPFCPFDLRATDLDSLVLGYKDSTARYSLSDDADFKGFSSICNKKYDVFKAKDATKNNELQLLLKIFYETSIEIFGKLKEK